MTKRSAIKGALFVLIFCFAVTSFSVAAEDSDKDKIPAQEILIQSGSPVALTGDLQESIESESSQVAHINNLIKELASWDADKVTRDIIEKIHDEYSSLSMAGQAKVEGYDLVEQYIESMRLSFPSETISQKSESDKGKKLGENYHLEFSDSVSISITYVTDSNHDGYPERPEIVITSPFGHQYNLTFGTTTLEDQGLKVFINWESEFVQLDFYSAEKGIWTLSTGNSVVFNSFTYAGRTDGSSFIPESDSEENSSEDRQSNDISLDKVTQAKRKLLKGLIGFAVILCCLFFGIKKLGSSNADNSFRRIKDPRKTKNILDEEDDVNLFEDMPEEKAKKELQAMEKYLRSQNILMDYGDEPDEEAANEKADSVSAAASSETEASEEFTAYPSGIIGDDFDDSEESEAEDERFGKRF